MNIHLFMMRVIKKEEGMDKTRLGISKMGIGSLYKTT